jgi:hypothetical protein
MPRPNVTATRHIIPSSSQSDMSDKENTVTQDDKMTGKMLRPRPQATQTDNKISGNSRSETCTLQNAPPVDYFYFYFFFFFYCVFLNIIVAEMNKYAQSFLQKHTILSSGSCVKKWKNVPFQK